MACVTSHSGGITFLVSLLLVVDAMNLVLVRFGYLEKCTLGRWHIGHNEFAGLGEPWIPDPDGPGGQRREGGKSESCIPDGLYTMRQHISEKYPRERYVWSISNPSLGVWHPGGRPAGLNYGRDAILVHAGTTVLDILGCELVGMRHGVHQGMDAVFESQAAMAKMRELLGMETHQLLIRPIAGTTETA